MHIDKGLSQLPMQERRPNRTAETENFPVASLLIARDLRPAVKAYYAMARAADDVADDDGLSAEAKIQLLDCIETALSDGAGYVATARSSAVDDRRDAVCAAAKARRILAERKLPMEHATRLLVAFRRDAVQPRIATWAELMDYCADSAAPVGRFLLDLHGETADGYPASDALCTALQVLNHLQDCADDYRRLNRIYLPADWLAEEGVPETDLAAARSSPGLRRVLDRCLNEIADLLARARPLPQRMRSVRLALETAVVVTLAEALARRLAALDPLAARVHVSKPAMLALAGIAVSRFLLHRMANPLSRRA